jgi:mono/diheme cytochrome c family protein
MKQRIAEIIALILTAVGILAVSIWPFFHEADAVDRDIPFGTRIIDLTGVATTGTWTEQAVNGMNYWRQQFRAARPVLQVGKPTLLRLKSADVLHAFYAPRLGIETVEVQPGHVVEILITPEQEGVFGYYCPTMCGDPHFAMRGVIIVQGERGEDLEIPRDEFESFWLEPPPPDEALRIERGGWLFRQKGCATCHGPMARGGVENWNYVKDTVPALNSLSEKMFLFYDEDVDAIVDLLERRIDLERLEDEAPVPRFNVVLAQYRSIRKVIENGSPAGKKDAEGPSPPLEMPAWQHRLSRDQIDSIIAYLLTLRPEGEEKDS